MPGGHATCEHGSLSVGGTNACVVSSSIVGDGEESSSGLQKTEKDPRRMARKYQLELCKKALEENIIVYLGTGCGKTHIAVLLIYEMGHLIRQPQKSACVFLAPTVALVNQQAKVIEDSTDFKVGVYCGNSNRLKTHSSWEKEIEQYEVLVMTPQILLYNLSHSFIKMDLIALLIFDECHHAQAKSNHPYAQIMKVFYKTNDGKLPRIFGMTASPVVGKGASSRDNLPRSINSLEILLDAKVYSVEDKEELESFVASPVIRVYSYGPVANGTSSSYEDYYNILQGFKHQCIMENGSKTVGNQSLESLRSTKKVLIRMHESIIFCLENLGLWGALQACRILLSGDHSEWNALIEAEGNISDVSVCDRYLNQAANVFAADCTRAGEAKKWMEAFNHGKQQAEFELSRGGSTRNKLNMEMEIINLEGHRPRVRRYAHGLKRLIRIGQGPETLLRQSSNLASNVRPDGYFDGEVGDAIEFHQWKCVRTVNGVRIFEDVSNSKSGKGVLVKAVTVIEASADTVFDVVLNLDRHQRYEWDVLTADLELLDSYDGHYDIVYGTCDSKCLSRWQSNKDFVFSRQWFRGQDGTYTILQFPAVHKKRPPRSGYQREKNNPSIWEIRNLKTLVDSNTAICLVTQMLEMQEAGWRRWKKNHSSKFEKTIAFALLSQVEGLKEYIAANPAFKFEHSSTVVHSKISDTISGSEYEDSEEQDEFYDAMIADSSPSSSEEESDDDHEGGRKDMKVKLKNVSWAITSLALKRASDPNASKDLDKGIAPIYIDPSQFHGSLNKGKDENDSNCWTSPSGTGFMIRGKTYLKDSSKVMGGDPLLKLIAVDWFKVDKAIDGISLHPRCLVQTEAGKKLPFILVINLQIPAKPNYSLVLCYAADRPINKSSLLGKFVDGTDLFRDSRFKLIPSIIEGYWMVKRAVGTKACLLGKAVTCKYLRQDNFLEIDVDIGSSSVARGVIGLVLGYVTSLVVDLAILIEAKEEPELPEYILGTVRLNRVRLDSAVPLEV